MRERIHLEKGELSITSQPAGGTTVYARVPFDAEERRIQLGCLTGALCPLLAWRNRLQLKTSDS
jgi:hypothetical protein